MVGAGEVLRETTPKAKERMSTPNEPKDPKTAGDSAGSSGPVQRPASSGGAGAQAPASGSNGTRPAVSVQDQPARGAETGPNKVQTSGDVTKAQPVASPAPSPTTGPTTAPVQGRPTGTGPGGVPPWQRAGAGPGPGRQPSPGPAGGPGKPPPPAGGQPPPGAVNQPPPGVPTQGRGPAGPPPGRPSSGSGAPGQQGGPSTVKRPVITGTAAPKLIDGPTRNIDRRDLVQEELPDLDAIHHPEATPAPIQPISALPTHGVAGAPLRASVQLRRIDPWAAFKVSAVLSVASFFVWMIAIGVLYLILDGMGVWDQVNSSFGTLVSSDTTTESSFEVSAGGVFGIAALIGAVNVILFTALATVGSFIYNLSSDLVGGLEVTLADRD